MGILKETIEDMKENCGGMTGGGMGSGGMMKPTNLLSFLVQRGKAEEEESGAFRMPGEHPDGEEGNEQDVVAMSVPLLIRVMELAREDIKDDATLHHVAKKMIELSAGGEPLSMDQYEEIIDGLDLGDHEEDMQGGEEDMQGSEEQDY